MLPLLIFVLWLLVSVQLQDLYSVENRYLDQQFLLTAPLISRRRKGIWCVLWRSLVSTLHPRVSLLPSSTWLFQSTCGKSYRRGEVQREQMWRMPKSKWRTSVEAYTLWTFFYCLIMNLQIVALCLQLVNSLILVV